MKRITHLVFLSALVFGAHSAWSQEVTEEATSQAAAVSAETSMSVAGAGGYMPRESAAMEMKAPKGDGLLELLGLSSRDGFPSKGGPIDD
jgi:hypothetical protein